MPNRSLPLINLRTIWVMDRNACRSQIGEISDFIKLLVILYNFFNFKKQYSTKQLIEISNFIKSPKPLSNFEENDLKK